MTTPGYVITNEDKINMINSHIRSIEMNKYTCELIILEQNALANPDQGAIERSNSQIADANAQLEALNAQKALLQ